jgi:hypothetical protein
MSPKRLLMTALVTVTVLVASAFAQKNELTGIIGRTFISDQGVKNVNLFNTNVHSGEGLTFEVNYGRHLMGENFWRLTFEVPAVFNFDEDLNFAANSVPEDYRSFFVTPSLRANAFATTAISPSTTGVMQIGVGLDVRLTPHFTLRGGARDFWSGTPDILVDTGKSRQHNYFVGGGVVWRFGKS